MTTMNDDLFDAATSYVFLEDGGGVASLKVDDAFWQQLRSRQPTAPGVKRFMSGNGWLVTTIDLTGDSSRWEVHTVADELLILISGAIDLIVETPSGEERIVELRPGKAFLVPRGTWHRFITRAPSQFVGVAYGQSGKGTNYRPIESRAAAEPAVAG